MSMHDPIADMLTRIRNAQVAKEKKVSMPASKLKKAMLTVLQQEGFIEAINIEMVDNKPLLTVTLKYFQGKPVIEHIKRVSSPGLRIYKNNNELPNLKVGAGIALITTSQGVMTVAQARMKKLGGEVLCLVS